MASINFYHKLASIAAHLYTSIANLKSKGENIFYSPLSIVLALTMLREGAREKTAAQLSAFLLENTDSTDLTKNARELLARAHELNASGVKLEIANALFVQQGLELLEAYKNSIVHNFEAQVLLLNFGESEAAHEAINSFVSDKTNKLIQEFLPARSIDPSIRLVLINTIYFKGNWKDQFDVKNTVEREFHVTATEAIKISMMHLSGRFIFISMAHLNELRLTIGALPYQLKGLGPGNTCEFLVFLPDELDGLTELEMKLAQNPSLLSELLSTPLKIQEISPLVLPRFKLDCELDIKQQLISLGVSTAFSESAADLSGIAKSNNLYVSKAMHRAVVIVNEEGTEAAGVIGLLCKGISRPKPALVCDHPCALLCIIGEFSI